MTVYLHERPAGVASRRKLRSVPGLFPARVADRSPPFKGNAWRDETEGLYDPMKFEVDFPVWVVGGTAGILTPSTDMYGTMFPFFTDEDWRGGSAMVRTNQTGYSASKAVCSC